MRSFPNFCLCTQAGFNHIPAPSMVNVNTDSHNSFPKGSGEGWGDAVAKRSYISIQKWTSVVGSTCRVLSKELFLVTISAACPEAFFFRNLWDLQAGGTNQLPKPVAEKPRVRAKSVHFIFQALQDEGS